MKKTNMQMIVDFFESRGGCATLGELLDAGRYTFSHEFTARISDLRAKGYTIKCQRNKIPSQNIYTMEPPEEPRTIAPNGQVEMFRGWSV